MTTFPNDTTFRPVNDRITIASSDFDDEGSSTTVMKNGVVVAEGYFDRGADGWFIRVNGTEKFFNEATDIADHFDA